MIISPATIKWDATNINRLKTHVINAKTHKAICNPRLHAMFSQKGELTDVDCDKCKRLAATA